MRKLCARESGATNIAPERLGGNRWSRMVSGALWLFELHQDACAEEGWMERDERPFSAGLAASSIKTDAAVFELRQPRVEVVEP